MQIQPGQRILVTGGNGFIGSRVVRQLVETGYKVRCLLRASSRVDRIRDLAFEQMIGDILNPDSLLVAVQDCDAIVHLASLSNWNDLESSMLHRVVVAGTRHMLTAGNLCGQLPMVYVSSAAAINGSFDATTIFTETSAFTLPRDGFSYAHAKHEAEHVCLAFASKGYPVTIVNPTEVYGPDDTELVTAKTLLALASGPIIGVPRGGTSIVHVDDVATGIIAGLQRGVPGQRYILGSDNLSFTELAKLIHQLLGLRKSVVALPDNIIQLAAWLHRVSGVSLGISSAQAPYAIRYWYMQNQKAIDALGITFRPAAAILKPTLDWLSKAGFFAEDAFTDRG